MGWAKYAEDNIEIMNDRLFLREPRCIENEIKEAYVKPSLPAANNAMAKSKVQAEVSQTTKFKDTYIICQDCGKEFLFSARAQKHFAAKRWNNPKRCKSCKDFKQARYLMQPSF